MWCWALPIVGWPRPGGEAGAALAPSGLRLTEGTGGGVHRTEAGGAPFTRLSAQERSAKAVYKAGGHCQAPTDSDVPRVAVNFYGLWRTVANVLPLLERNVIAPSRSVGLVDHGVPLPFVVPFNNKSYVFLSQHEQNCILSVTFKIYKLRIYATIPW